jgi:anti-sigma B factor antagonist
MDNENNLKVRTLKESAAVIDIKGELTSESENGLMDAYTRANTAQARTIILNFAGLEYMNSSGIGLLVTLLRTLPANF